TLAAPRHSPAINDSRVFRHGLEVVANLVAVGRKVFIDSDEKDRSGWHGQSPGNWLDLCGGRRGGWPVVGIGRLVGVLWGVSWLGLRILSLLLAWLFLSGGGWAQAGGSG